MSLELGGNAPLIVFEDADIPTAVAGTIASKFRGSGQTCVCANRIYVHDAIYDEFAKKLAEKVAEFKVGPGFGEGVTHGPLIHARQADKVEEVSLLSFFGYPFLRIAGGSLLIHSSTSSARPRCCQEGRQGPCWWQARQWYRVHPHRPHRCQRRMRKFPSTYTEKKRTLDHANSLVYQVDRY